MHILVVDDEAVFRDLIAECLEDSGYEPLTACDGSHALDILANESDPPSLILSDITMPRLNGTELARKLKANARLRHIPIVLMSAAERPPTACGDYFIAKPFDLDALMEVIERYLNPSRQTGRRLSA